ncbi:MAG: O-acetyl-ADP-ribose deacetylase [Polyangiales bacterium]
MTAKVLILRGDLTQQSTDAIVNAANPRMLGGGGVDGAIHRAAGPALLQACRAVPELRPGVRCPTGEARLTPGFGLRAPYVIHAVGPVYSGRSEDAQLLASAFRASLALAEQHQLRSVAFPAISCGIYRYPIAEAASIASQVVGERAWNLREIRFVLLTDDTMTAWARAFASSSKVNDR